MEECNTGLKFNNFVLGKLRSVPSQQHLLYAISSRLKQPSNFCWLNFTLFRRLVDDPFCLRPFCSNWLLSCEKLAHEVFFF